MGVHSVLFLAAIRDKYLHGFVDLYISDIPNSVKYCFAGKSLCRNMQLQPFLLS